MSDREKEISPFTMYLVRDLNDKKKLKWSQFAYPELVVGRSYEMVETGKWGTYTPEYVEVNDHELSEQEIAMLRGNPALNIQENTPIAVMPEVELVEFSEEKVQDLRRLREIN